MAKNIADGTWGTCPWKITNAGELIIGAGKAVNDTPWESMCGSIKSVIIEDGVDTSEVTDMSFLFVGSEMQTINLSGLDVSNVENMQNMFQDCEYLQTVKTGGWNVINVTDMSSMFSGCKSLKSLDIGLWNMPSATELTGMFQRSGVEYIDLRSLNLKKVKGMSYMFWQCENLVLPVAEWANLPKNVRAEDIFAGCEKLKQNIKKMYGLAY